MIDADGYVIFSKRRNGNARKKGKTKRKIEMKQKIRRWKLKKMLGRHSYAKWVHKLGVHTVLVPFLTTRDAMLSVLRDSLSSFLL